MGLKCGIVGMPNVGKSTLFNALTQSQVAAENYPFCTIEPNLGIIPVPDARLEEISLISQSAKTIPAHVEILDIAGLVAGSSKGEGLGNKFLSHIREVTAILHVLPIFHSATSENTINPIHALDIIDTELALADIETLEKSIFRTGKFVAQGDSEAKYFLDLLKQCQAQLDQNQRLSCQSLSAEDRKLLKPLSLLTLKPQILIANINEVDAETDLTKQAKEIAMARGAPLLTVCAKLEAEIADLSREEKNIFLQEVGMSESGLDRIVRAAYQHLGLLTFFTSGEKETRAWTITRQSTAQQAAAVIHTDMARGFIRAETIAGDDFIRLQGEKAARQAGLMRLEGKDYIVQDGDILHIRFNV